MVRLGIDIGATGFKIIVLGRDDEILYSNYIAHCGDIVSHLDSELKTAGHISDKVFFGVTGSMVKKMAHLSDFFLTEIPAAVEGALFMNKDVKSIMEIGANQSRFITKFSKESKQNVRFFLNSSCSSGTGSFLEEQASRLNIPLTRLSEYTQNSTKRLRIAGRCSVFSKTDMIHFQQTGAKTEDILMGLVFAMIRNYKSNVVRKQPVTTPVFLSGGVMEIYGIKEAIMEVFGLQLSELVLVPEFIQVNAAGAALAGKTRNSIISIEELRSKIHKNIAPKNLIRPTRFFSYPDLNRFSLDKFGKGDDLNRHTCHKIAGRTTGRIKAYLGVDVGSTSTNLVLINKAKQVLAYRYLRTRGAPLKAVAAGMDSLRREFGKDLTILGTGITGSGRYLAGKKLEADLIVNEITAQAEGTLFFHPAADTIFEIGGQDAKYIRIENSVVVDFEMNRICAAGTGSFLEEQAKKIGVQVTQFGDIALEGTCPIDLGDRCTVFIEGAVSKAIARGENKNNIIAGLAYSIVRNYLTRVKGNKSVGNNIFLQGGIAHNQGVVNAFRAILGQEIRVPQFFSVTGALGVAVLTADQDKKKQNRSPESSPSINIWEESEREFLKGYTKEIDPSKPTVGIPRVLFLHKLFVLFNCFFKESGFNVVLSDATTREIVALSQETSLEETCYPVKLANGHVAALIEKKVDYIFLPTVYTMKHEVSKIRKDYGCVYMQTVAQIVDHAMDLKTRGIKLLCPQISFKFGKRYMAKTILAMGKEIGRSKLQTVLAMRKAIIRLMQYNKDIDGLGKKFLGELSPMETAFVIITRPYGVNDPELNMGIPNRLMSMGYKVMTLAALGIENRDISEDYPNMYWPFGQHILAGAKVIRSTPNLYAIYLTNHGCGPDTALLHLFGKEMQGKPFLHLEVDEHASKVGIITRLEAFVHSFDKIMVSPVPPLRPEKLKRSERSKNTNDILYLPNFYPYSDLVCGLLKSRDIKAQILPETDGLSFEKGKSLSVAKEYLSFVTLMGDVIKKTEDSPDQKFSFLIPSTEGTEVSGMYETVIQSLVGDKNPCISIQNPFVEDIIVNKTFERDFFLMILAGDIIMAASPNSRKDLLTSVLKLIQDNSLLSEEDLFRLARQAIKSHARSIYARSISTRSILVIGESSIIFNPFNNHNLFATLEKECRLISQPMAEVFYLFWHDFGKRIKNSLVQKNLAAYQRLMVRINEILDTISPFEQDPRTLIMEADKRLPLFSGSNGRYRLAKLCSTCLGVNGIITVGSAYENTGIVIRQLGDHFLENKKPAVLNLLFDGSDHNRNNDLIHNFLYYL